jgi:hypothetical protein
MASLDNVEQKKTGMELLVEKSVPDKLAIFLTMLGDLKNRNHEKSTVQAITKTQILEQVHYKATAKAYHDAQLFFLKVFEPELKAILAPEKEGSVIIQ